MLATSFPSPPELVANRIADDSRQNLLCRLVRPFEQVPHIFSHESNGDM